ncbi:alpha/beta hydrolase [Acidipropionibacterium timonense]|uniref:alpha/beta hydrolase n=1 Tax=Acidipropionibacterium timonense TaxID=2161818 RepID=UPI00103174E3|nr:alpha/beta hydrolase [Acidipropionibacterium timonense]
MTALSWRPDTVVDGFESAAVELPDAQRVPGDPEGPLTATLVRRRRDGGPRRRALLYVHGWSDCFYQCHLADEVESWGMDFHALDLRRYGRNLVPGQRSGWVGDLSEYDEEIDAAVRLLAADHDSVTIMGHSTGGLTVPLWVSRHPGAVDGVILNSPWIDMQGSALTRATMGPLARTIRRADPGTVLPLPERDNFGRSVRAEFGGEWSIPVIKDPPWAPFKVRAGWLAAITGGHDEIAGGLGIQVPVLCLMSARSDLSTPWNEGMRRADTVLDVERLAAASVHLGRHLTLVRIDGGLHDLVLSAPPVRAEVFAQMRRWVRAYLAA